MFGVWPRRAVDISLERLLHLMERYDVDQACAVSMLGVFYDVEAGNEEAYLASRHHRQILPVGTLNFAAYIGWEDEFKRRLEQGFKVFRFFPSVQEWSINGLAFRRFVEVVGEHPDVVLMIPAAEGIESIASVMMGVSNPIVITSFRYTHLGEIIEAAKIHPSLYVETHMINSPDFLQILSEHVGLERVLYGSNAPLQYMGSALMPITKARIDDKARQAVLASNLEGLLGGSVL